ncbi:MAG: S-layer homology domain-containing protein, partial [Bacillota bacterium]
MITRRCENRGLKWILAAAFVVAALALSPTYALAQSETVTDVPTDHWAYTAVEELVSRGYLELYPDRTFRGNESVTRYQLAQVVYALLQGIDPLAKSTPQDDVELLRRLTTEFREELVMLAADVESINTAMDEARKERVVL